MATELWRPFPSEGRVILSTEDGYCLVAEQSMLTFLTTEESHGETFSEFSSGGSQESWSNFSS